jgi:protocatechuate 3,4-dioxygenase beta subunit
MRPILVLALVLAAIAALLFGVFSLLKDNPAPPPITAPLSRPVEPTPKPSALGTELDGKNRTTPALAKPAEDRTPAVNGTQAPIFNNSLVGQVRSPQGAPLADVEVTLSTMPTAGELFFPQDMDETSPDTKVRTNAEGRFAFKNIIPRSHYTLVAKHPDYARKEVQSVTVGQEGEFEEPPIVLSSGATLTGRVRDEQNNMIPDATLMLEGSQFQGSGVLPPDRMVAKTNNEGIYTFSNVQHGSRALTVSAPGYGRQNINNLTFEKDETNTRDIVLRTAEMILGRVVGPNNQGLAGATVIAVGFSVSTQTGRDQVTTNEQGEFAFEDLGPGDYNVIAQLKGYRLEKPQRGHTNGDRVVLEMAREASVCGTVIDPATNAPVTSFACRLRLYYGDGLPSAPSDANFQQVDNPKGEFCLEGVSQASYVVEAQAPGFAPSLSPSFVVMAGKNVQGVTVRMVKGGGMSGRVVDPDGKPVARARITTHDNDWTDDDFTRSLGIGMPTATTPVDVRTDAEGRFNIPNLASATYQIIVEAQGFTNHMQHDININDGSEQKLGDLTMMRGGSLSGTLFDPAGKPLAGGRASLRAAPNSGLMVFYDAKSGVDGKFFFANVQPGNYQLSGSRAASGEGIPLDVFQDIRKSTKLVTINDNETKVLDLVLSD